MYKFEWYHGIKNQRDFVKLVQRFKTFEGLANYEQAARLFYQRENETIMIELQIPTLQDDG